LSKALILKLHSIFIDTNVVFLMKVFVIMINKYTTRRNLKIILFFSFFNRVENLQQAVINNSRS
jgi:hypothetical protein